MANVTRRTALVALLGFGGSVVLGACTTPSQVQPNGPIAYGENFAPREPPPMRYETRPDAPPSGRADSAYWVDGRWRWDGQEFSWVGGHYQDPPHRGAMWQVGHWERGREGWVYVGGRWT